MRGHDPRAVANEFLELAGEAMPQIKLQKLVYIAHGWNLAIHNAPLATGDFEAWDGGPVSRRLWNHVRDFGYVSKRLKDNRSGKEVASEFSKADLDVISHVWNKYGSYSGFDLSEMTRRSGTPWSKAYWERGRNAGIQDEKIREHFVELALAGRQARAS